MRYRRVKKVKRQLLEKAFAHFQERIAADTNAASEFTEFCRAEASWLDDYTFFRALMEKNGGRETWDRWPERASQCRGGPAWLEALAPQAPRKIRRARRIFFVTCNGSLIANGARFAPTLKPVAWRSWATFHLASVITARMCFARPNEFALEWSGGAPPEPYFKDDEFTQKWGQNWGIPVYRWEVMRTNNFAWWRQRVRGVRQIFHVFRIDHVLGFYRIYAFPWRPARNQEFLPLDWNEMRSGPAAWLRILSRGTIRTQENCEANRREGEEYLRVVLEEAGETRVVGEDLGTVPDYVRPSLQFVRHCWVQDSAMGKLSRRPIDSRERIPTLVRRDLRHARSQADSRVVG